MQSLDTTLLSRRVETLRKLDISKIKAVTSLTNIPEFLSEFSLAVIGKPEESDLSSLILDVDMSEMGDRKAENMAWAPLLGRIRAVLESIPREHLVKSRLVTASCPGRTDSDASRTLHVHWLGYMSRQYTIQGSIRWQRKPQWYTHPGISKRTSFSCCCIHYPHLRTKWNLSD